MIDRSSHDRKTYRALYIAPESGVLCAPLLVVMAKLPESVAQLIAQTAQHLLSLHHHLIAKVSVLVSQHR